MTTTNPRAQEAMDDLWDEANDKVASALEDLQNAYDALCEASQNYDQVNDRDRDRTTQVARGLVLMASTRLRGMLK